MFEAGPFDAFVIHLRRSFALSAAARGRKLSPLALGIRVSPRASRFPRRRTAVSNGVARERSRRLARKPAPTWRSNAASRPPAARPTIWAKRASPARRAAGRSTSITTGIGSAPRPTCGSSSRNGAAAPSRSASAASGDSTSCCRSPRRSKSSPSAKGRRCCTPRTAWPAMSARGRGGFTCNTRG